MNRERERVLRARCELETAARQLDTQWQTHAAQVRQRRLPWLVGSGLATGFAVVLMPLRLWPQFAATLIRGGSLLARSRLAPALLARSFKYLLGKGSGVDRSRSRS